jgi:hypothetical protein
MKNKMTYCILAFAFLFASVFTLPSARADDWASWDQATKMTFSEPVQIPGRVLPAGTYWFVLLDSVSAHDLVRVFNADRTILYATVITVGTQNLTTPDKTAITFAKLDSMQPQAIVTWFYPGEPSGHQFLYSKMKEHELAQVQKYTVVAKAPPNGESGVAGF